ncbi:MAG: hypothetical protein HZB61_01300 [Nitrospirae bacterium]|nr:hypothetical protein [Nitrospirota bacterium]
MDIEPVKRSRIAEDILSAEDTDELRPAVETQALVRRDTASFLGWHMIQDRITISPEARRRYKRLLAGDDGRRNESGK